MSTSTINDSEALIVAVDPRPLVQFDPPHRAGEPPRSKTQPIVHDAAPTSAFRHGIDFLASALIFIACLPAIALIGLMIKLDSRGPVFFLQQRVGLSGKRFKMVKFRTMHANATELINNLPPELQQELHVVGSLKNDPRITRIGKWIRKFSLDELPQLWNVLRGDMSLIGPRPYLANQLSRIVRSHRVLRVKPGMTGLWQVTGRNQITLRRRVCIDLHYVANRGLLLDLWILCRTPWVVLMKTEEAY